MTAMDPSLQTAIQNSTVLSSETRAKLLQAGPTLTPEKIARLLQLLNEAEAKATQIAVEREAKKREADETYLKGVHDFLNHDFPRLMHSAEEKDKEKEGAELENILSQLTNA